jgi:hypothetical protein
MYSQIKKASGFSENDFDNFDPDNFDADVYSDMYDPDNATGATASTAATKVKTAQPGQKLQLNIVITNNAAVQLVAEMFSALDSVTTRKKAEYAVGNYLYIPKLSYEGLALTTNFGTVGYSQDGLLHIKGGMGENDLTIGCGEYPYNSLVESTKTLPMKVSFIRYTVATDAQISNNITWFKRTFGGKTETNTISPRAYFKPNQFQNKTIDILAGFTIDSESGLTIPINAAESVTLALFVQRWGKPQV